MFACLCLFFVLVCFVIYLFCLLFVVCCLLFVVCCLLLLLGLSFLSSFLPGLFFVCGFVVCCLWFCRLLFVVVVTTILKSTNSFSPGAEGRECRGLDGQLRDAGPADGPGVCLQVCVVCDLRQNMSCLAFDAVGSKHV